MKLTNVAAIVAVAALSAVATAQRPPMGGPGGGGMGRGRMTPQEQATRRTEMMTQMLSLTPAQQAKVKALILKNALAIKKIRDAEEAQLKKMLTPEQVKKMGSMRGMAGPGGPGGGRRGPGAPRV